MGSELLSSGSWCVQSFVCALPDWSLCFPQPSGEPIIKSRWPSRPDSLGIPSPFVRSPGWEAWHGVQNLYNSVRTSLVLLFSSLWVTHSVGMGFDFIMIAPLLLSRWGFFFVSGHGVSFLGGFQCPPVNGFQQLVAIWCSLGRRWAHFFYSTILNRKPYSCFLMKLFTVFCICERKSTWQTKGHLILWEQFDKEFWEKGLP